MHVLCAAVGVRFVLDYVRETGRGDRCGLALCGDDFLPLALPFVARIQGVLCAVEGLLGLCGVLRFLNHRPYLMFRLQLDLLPQVVMVFEQRRDFCGVQIGIALCWSVHAQHEVIAGACGRHIEQAHMLVIVKHFLLLDLLFVACRLEDAISAANAHLYVAVVEYDPIHASVAAGVQAGQDDYGELQPL